MRANHVGEEYKNRQGLTGVIIEKTNIKTLKGCSYLYNVLIKETNNVVTVSYGCVKRGIFKDWSHPSVLGVGISFEGATKNELYNLWCGMLDRCYDSKRKDYSRYGGRGVRVSDRWLSFKNFIDDFQKIDGYSDYVTDPSIFKLDKDIKGNGLLYSLENCKLVSNEENCQYTCKTEKIICINAKGEETTYTSISKCSRRLGLDASSICKVLRGKQKTHKGYYFRYEREAC